MARDLRGTHRAAPRPRPGFSRRASRLLPHPRGKPPVAAKAWEASAPVRTPPASLRDLPNSATPPTSATLPARISRSIVFGSRREDTVLPLAGELPEWASPSPAAPAILPAIPAPSIVLHHRRHQPRRKVLCHALQCRVLLFKKILNANWVVHVRGDFVLVAENKIVRVIENLSRLALFERDLALQGYQHRRRAPRRRIKQQRHRFQTQHLAPQHRVAVRRIGYHSVRGLQQEFMHRRGRQSLLDAVTGRLVFQCRHRNHMNALRQRTAPPRQVIPAARRCQRQHHRHSQHRGIFRFEFHSASFSASLTAFAAGNRILSAAPQNHQVSRRPESCSGGARWMDFSPATLTLLGASSELAAITKPADLHADSIFSKFNPAARGSNAAEAANAVP